MSSKDFRFGISSSVQGVDLNQLLVDHALSTYFMRLAEELPEFELHAKDVLLVDRAVSPRKSDLVVVAKADDPELKITRFSEIGEGIELWGVVTNVIRDLRS